MQIEYEEFDTVEDVFMYMSSAAPPMKNTMPVNSYKGYVMSFIPLSSSIDFTTKSFKKVDSIERADKNYFISLTPKRNTIADVAIEKL
jgi:hypothetical protein